MLQYNSICLISFVYLYAQPLMSVYYITELAHNKLHQPDLKGRRKDVKVNLILTLSFENPIHNIREGIFCLFTSCV